MGLRELGRHHLLAGGISLGLSSQRTDRLRPHHKQAAVITDAIYIRCVCVYTIFIYIYTYIYILMYLDLPLVPYLFVEVRP